MFGGVSTAVEYAISVTSMLGKGGLRRAAFVSHLNEYRSEVSGEGLGIGENPLRSCRASTNDA